MINTPCTIPYECSLLLAITYDGCIPKYMLSYTTYMLLQANILDSVCDTNCLLYQEVYCVYVHKSKGLLVYHFVFLELSLHRHQSFNHPSTIQQPCRSSSKLHSVFNIDLLNFGLINFQLLNFLLTRLCKVIVYFINNSYMNFYDVKNNILVVVL